MNNLTPLLWATKYESFSKEDLKRLISLIEKELAEDKEKLNEFK